MELSKTCGSKTFILNQLSCVRREKQFLLTTITRKAIFILVLKLICVELYTRLFMFAFFPPVSSATNATGMTYLSK